MSATTNQNPRQSNPRCSVCKHPDRERLDRALVLRTRTQQSIADELDVARSSISRHVKNHILPQVASGIVLGKDNTVFEFTEEIDRVYAGLWELRDRAAGQDDLRAALGFHKEIRLLLVLLANVGEKMAQGGLRYLTAWGETDQQDHAEYYRRVIAEKLEQIRNSPAAHYKRLTGPDGDAYRSQLEASGYTIADLLHSNEYASFDEFIERFPLRHPEAFDSEDKTND